MPHTPEHSEETRKILEQGNVIGQSAERFAASQGIKAPFTPTTFTKQTQPSTAVTPSGAVVNPQTGELVTPPPAITGEDLKQPPSITPQTASPPRESFPIKDIPIPELPVTQPEKEATDLTSQIQKLNERILGQAAFKTEQEQTLGVEGMRKTQLDLTNQLRTLQAEAEATKISSEFEQRNVLQPFAEGERGKKLRDVGVRALIVGANLQAAQGNLAFALDQIDRAVAQKFGPIEEEIKVKKDNLDLILKSAEFSRTDKERALKQKAIQEAKEKEIEKQKKEQEEIWKTGVDAAKGGADAITLRSIQNAKTKEEVLKLAAPFLKKPETTTGDVAEFEDAKRLGLIPAGTSFFEFVKRKGEMGRKGGEVEEEPLSILDIQRIAETYGVNLPFGVTQRQAEKLIFETTKLKEFTDEEFRQIALTAKAEEETFEQVIADIDANTQILNKDRAKLIVSEIYGKGRKGLLRGIFSGEKREEIKLPPSPKITGKEIQEGTARQISTLFDQVKVFNSQFSGF